MVKLFKFFVISILFVTSSAMAAEMKVGILNLQQVIQQSPQLESIKNSLQKQFGSAQQNMTTTQKALQDDMSNMRKNAAVMTAADKQKLQAKIAQEQQAFQGMQAKFQQDYFAARDKAFAGLLAQVKQIVENYAKKQKYDLIITNEAVAYASSDMDVTKDILKALKDKK